MPSNSAMESSVNARHLCAFCAFLWLRSNPFLMRHKHGHELIQPFRILIVEPAVSRTIEIEYAEQPFTVEQWHYDLRIRRYVARDVTRKLMHVRHDDRLAPLGCNAAHTLTKRDAHTRGISLKRTKHTFVVLQEIEPGPVYVRQ